MLLLSLSLSLSLYVSLSLSLSVCLSLSLSWKFRFASVLHCWVCMFRSFSQEYFLVLFLRCILFAGIICILVWRIECCRVCHQEQICKKDDLCLNLYPWVIKYYYLISVCLSVCLSVSLSLSLSLWVRACVCVRARARVCVCVCVSYCSANSSTPKNFYFF